MAKKNARLSDKQLSQAVDAYYENRGNRSEAARYLGLSRTTYNDRLSQAEERLGLKVGKVADGRELPAEMESRPLPAKGKVSWYVCTCAQNNTRIVDGFRNLEALTQWLGKRPDTDAAELIVGTVTYNRNAYGHGRTQKGGGKGNSLDDQELWYDPEVRPYLVEHDVLLAPGLVFAGRQNILPTRKFPLSNKADLNGRMSNVVPHTKMHLESVPAMVDEATKLNMTTGTVTMRNYVQKDAGLVAEQEHTYGAMVVGVDSDGDWYPMHLELGDRGEVQWCGPDGYSAVTVEDGKVRAVRTGQVDDYSSVVEAVNWGDTHAAELDLWVRELAFGEGGILDTLRPRIQFHNDLLSFRSRSHHEIRDFFRSYEKHTEGADSVEDEVRVTADVLAYSERDWCETVVVPSNHDRHLERWVNEAEHRLDPLNARFWAECLLAKLEAIEEGLKDFSLMEWALRKKGRVGPVRFLSEDESYVVAKQPGFPGVECGLHGDQGPNGARGSTSNLLKLGRPINKGHDHIATRRGLVMSAGGLPHSRRFPYMRGPNSHSIALITTFKNGARSHIIMWNHKWRPAGSHASGRAKSK